MARRGWRSCLCWLQVRKRVTWGSQAGEGVGGEGGGQVALELVQMTVSAALFLIPVRYFLLPLIYLNYRGVLYATLLIVQYS